MLKGKARSAEEITGIKGCKSFDIKNERGNFSYREEMNCFSGKILELELTPIISNIISCYDYVSSNGYFWITEWLENVHDETDWSEVSVDSKVLILNEIKRYFAKYKNGKIYTWEKGRTSWTTEIDNIDSLHSWNFRDVKLIKY